MPCCCSILLFNHWSLWGSGVFMPIYLGNWKFTGSLEFKKQQKKKNDNKGFHCFLTEHMLFQMYFLYDTRCSLFKARKYWYIVNPLLWTNQSSWFAAGLFFAVDRLAYLSMVTACITTMLDQICLVLCRHRSSLVTWLAFAMASFSCLALLDFVLLCSLFVTFTSLSSVNSGLAGSFWWIDPCFFL